MGNKAYDDFCSKTPHYDYGPPKGLEAYHKAQRNQWVKRLHKIQQHFIEWLECGYSDDEDHNLSPYSPPEPDPDWDYYWQLHFTKRNGAAEDHVNMDTEINVEAYIQSNEAADTLKQDAVELQVDQLSDHICPTQDDIDQAKGVVLSEADLEFAIPEVPTQEEYEQVVESFYNQ